MEKTSEQNSICKSCGLVINSQDNYCKRCGYKQFTGKSPKYDIHPSRRSRLIALILVILTGVIGGHRYYVGKIGTGILFTLTGGFAGFGTLYDLIMICIGRFTDCHGYPLKTWEVHD